MDSTTVSGAVGSGSIPDGCTDNISNLISEIFSNIFPSTSNN